MKTRTKAIGCGIILILLAALILNPWSLELIGGLLWVHRAESEIHRTQSAMKEPRIYEPTGELLALYCQSDKTTLPDFPTAEWLPKELTALNENCWALVNAEAKCAQVEMGGGFHHFGYYLEHDPNESSPGRNAWKLTMYDEFSDSSSDESAKKTHLKTFYLAPERQLTPEDFERLVGHPMPKRPGS